MARDVVERELADIVRSAGADALEELTLLDNRLRDVALRIGAFRRAIAAWRTTAKPPEEAWWWFPDAVVPNRIERVERVIELLALLLLPLSLAFAIDLAARFGRQGAGVAGALPVIVATALGSVRLVASGFRPRVAAFLRAVGLAGRYWRGAISFLILLGILAICFLWLARPALSRHYNDRGAEALVTPKQLAVARLLLERAVRLDPANPVAHYNLARVHEDLLEEEEAAVEYRIAVAAGLDRARNNLGRLYVRSGEYGRAAALLGPALVANRSELGSAPDVRYNLLKNLGWARIGQHRFREARSLLEEATHLLPDQAPAHCLLARALTEGGLDSAEREWRQCLSWANPKDPDEDAWMGDARAALSPAPRG